MRATLLLLSGLPLVLGLGGLACGGASSDGATPADGGSDGTPVDEAGDGGPEAGASASCTPDMLAGGCVAGRCRLTAPRGSLAEGSVVLLGEVPLPASLFADAIGPVLCNVVLPPGGPLSQELALAIAVDAPIDPGSALFLYPSAGGPSLVGTSSAQSHGVAGTITQTGSYGVTVRPPGWSVDGYAGVDVPSSNDPASLLRNVSSKGINAEYWDGTRLFVGNGARVLVYQGLPRPGDPPSIVLGQPNLDVVSDQPTSSTLLPVRGIWSNGTKLVVANGHRVLVWNSMPTASFTPADLVLGQPDFASNGANTGGVSASSMNVPTQIDSDGTRLSVADTYNNRVLVWSTFPVASGQPASNVIGQPSFSDTGTTTGATPLFQPWGALLAGTGMWVVSLYGVGVAHVASAIADNPAPDFTAINTVYRVQPDTACYAAQIARVGTSLALREPYGSRVGVFRAEPTSGGGSYDYVLGQPDRGRQTWGPTNASFVPGGTAYSYGLSGSGARLFVPGQGRFLLFDSPSYDYEPASYVFGQAGFSVDGPIDYRGVSARTLADPSDVAISGTTVAVADRANNRVLIYDRAGLSGVAPAAAVVLGQPDFTSYTANLDLVSPSGARLSGPAGVALDASHLIVADTENHRVLIWSPVPTTSGAPASVVLGQADFTGRRPNHGRADVSPADGLSDAAANGFFYPTGVATDGTHLVVADRLNHRVLVWNAIPTSNDAPADGVLGQSSFGANVANRGGGPANLRADGFDLPTGVTIRGTSLFVADTENNRVVRVSNAFTAPAADAWVGQPDGATLSNPNWITGGGNIGLGQLQPTAAASVLHPRAVAVTPTALYVTERDSNRVHVFDSTTLAHVGVLGQTGPTGASANVGGLGAASLSGPSGAASDGTTLFVADAGNHRVVGWDVSSAPVTGAAASLFVGQASALANGFNQASAASGSASGRPRGLARFGADLFVADTGHNRVLVLPAPPKAGDAPKRVYGQPDANLILPNAGGAPSARSLHAPRGVFADAKHVVVADTGNHRVLVFDATTQGTDAAIVLGQTSFADGRPNAGAAPSLATLAAPEGVWSDGVRLFVADTGNHRVLVWNAFPSQSGTPADLVLGQTGPDQVLGNRGASVAGAGTLSSPSAVLVAGGALFVSDTGNNRVLRWSTLPVSSGELAASALGQPDLAGRSAASTAADLAHLAGPSGLAQDGTNLYVADRDLGRVLAFALPATSTGASAATSFGPAGGLSLSGPAGLAVEPTPLFTSRLYVTDTGNDRLAVLASVSRLTP